MFGYTNRSKFINITKGAQLQAPFDILMDCIDTNKKICNPIKKRDVAIKVY